MPVFVALVQLECRISHSSSLKDKRRVVKSLVDRIRSRFNISAAETGALDNIQQAVLGISMVGNDKRYLSSQLSSLQTWIEQFPDLEVINIQLDWL